jgi:hypothetical protein
VNKYKISHWLVKSILLKYKRCFCNGVYALLQKDDRVCAQLFCFDAGSGYCVAYRPAAEGSACGDGQVKFELNYFNLLVVIFTDYI